MADVHPSAERPHPPDANRQWEESWSLDAVDDQLALFVRLALRPHDRVAWYWAYAALPDGAVVVVRDHELSLPRAGLEVRGDGLWADTICETPFEHWSYGAEAFAVRLDDPRDALTGERGERLPFGLDVEWELGGDPIGGDRAGYSQTGVVHGDVVIGVERIELRALALRRHRWGPCDWWAASVSAAPEVVGSSARVIIPLVRPGDPRRALVHDIDVANDRVDPLDLVIDG
jgi:hypothetical protein